MEVKPSEEKVALWKDLFAKYLTRLTSYIRHVILLEDIADTLKACWFLFVLLS